MKLIKEYNLREIAGKTLLVPTGKIHLDMDEIITLNEVGAEIWRLLPEAENEKDVADRLSANYDVEPAVLLSHVHAFLDQLREIGIL